MTSAFEDFRGSAAARRISTAAKAASLSAALAATIHGVGLVALLPVIPLETFRTPTGVAILALVGIPLLAPFYFFGALVVGLPMWGFALLSRQTGRLIAALTGSVAAFSAAAMFLVPLADKADGLLMAAPALLAGGAGALMFRRVVILPVRPRPGRPS
ncbi:MAG TPA: hypothetical protein VGN74_07315 [Brevundimonas sp.]|jgi:hypothetical protein|uniref:hypothetical protein n=1 Tax=Brevundimonas sp. TaxID=1871086 RepID=UPI002E13660B|nr:hypothetical protein [Brevundimonas sp.]